MPLVSHLASLGIVEPRAYAQDKIFESGLFFFKCEGILPAPESSHAIAAAIDEALEAKRTESDGGGVVSLMDGSLCEGERRSLLRPSAFNA